MSFTNQGTTMAKPVAGELISSPVGATILTAKSLENGLKVGRFAKLDTARLDNMDGSAAPVVAGVVLRSVANATESLATIDTDIFSSWEYIRTGLVLVSVKAGETPAKFGRVYVSNAGDASDGLALAAATATSVPVNAEFIELYDTNVWLVNLALADVTGNADVFASATTATALPVTQSANIAITTAGAATRTLANPAVAGITLSISMSVDAGDCVITAASAINQTGNNTITMNDAGDYIQLQAVTIAGALRWRVTANDGTALTTV
jgi:hypothetical protein